MLFSYALNGVYPNPYKLDVSKLDGNVYLEFTKTGGGELHIFYKNPTDKEIKEIQNGDIQVSFSVLFDVLIFQVKFGSLYWMDTPYSANISMLNYNIFDFEQDLKDNEGYLLNIFLIDTNTNIIKALRTVSLPNRFSQHLKENILVQLNQSTFTEEEYDKNLSNIFSNYSTKDLLRYSVIRERI